MPPTPLAGANLEALLALNNAHATELSWLSAERLATLLDQAFYASGMGDLDAALIAFDQDSAYDGQHFAWHRSRYPRFVYIDRVVVAPTARRRGLAATLYADLFATAAAAGHSLVTCEVNASPPNPDSDAFHARLGFRAVGAGPAPGGKIVRYFARALP